MQYYVQNITVSDLKYEKQHIDSSELYKFICNDFIASYIPMVYEYSDNMCTCRTMFHNEFNQPKGVVYLHKQSSNKYLITKVVDSDYLPAKNLVKVVDDYLNSNPTIFKFNIDESCVECISSHIDRNLKVRDAILDMLLNGDIAIHLQSNSLLSTASVGSSGYVCNLYMFIHIVKSIVYGIPSDIITGR